MRKRELTVEVWQKDMVRNRKLVGEVPPLRLLSEVSSGTDGALRLLNLSYEMQMAESWDEAGRQVYEFDPDFADSILGESWISLLPDCIEHRPHDCFYMKLPCGKLNEGTVVRITPVENIIGFDPSLFTGCESGKGVYIGGDPRFGSDESRCVVNTGGKLYALCSFAISKTFDLMLDDTPVDPYPTDLVANGVAYICSLNADIRPSYAPPKGVRENRAKRRSSATWHDVGYRIGADLRAYRRYARAESGHRGGTVRPHMRRAHWHRYWTGPMDGERRLVLKWLAPTAVNGGEIESATGHRVSNDRR